MKKNLRLFNLLVSCLFPVVVACSQNDRESQFDRAKMDSLFAKISKNQKGMGSISIFHDGKEVYE